MKPIHFGPAWSVVFLPLLLVAGAISFPYALVRKEVTKRRERRFAEHMKVRGRMIDWPDFVRKVSAGDGTLIVERFSLKGPVRMWWTADDLYGSCPHPSVDWFTMQEDANFDAVREWCRARYTGAGGNALLVIGSREQWIAIFPKWPLELGDKMRYLEVPPPRSST
jgi:hypothetical protein